MKTVVQTDIRELPLLSRGKVRDIYTVDDKRLLIVTTDRISAFDVILPDPIPRKGAVLNQITLFWMNKFKNLVPNHILSASVDKYPQSIRCYAEELGGRSALVKRAEPLPIECIVRGYITGSGWKDYQKSGEVCGHKLPAGLVESQQLPEPIFTPSTKAELGDHDENITLDAASRLVGPDLLERVETVSLEIFRKAGEYARERGIIIADTKFEFGMVDGELNLIDEVLTPDSSRFWPADGYTPGQSQPSFDKQFVRDYLSSIRFNKQPPAPSLPPEIIDRTSEKYLEAFERLTGNKLPV